jgi:hypothetical protein
VVAGAAVSYSGGTTTTDVSGAYSFTGVTEGVYDVSVSASGYNAQSRSVSVGPGATAAQNFGIVPLPGTVSGSVADSANATAIVGATVSYSGGSTNTDASGHYSLSSVTEGSYAFTASAPGYSPKTQTVSVGPGGSVSLDFSLVKRAFADNFESGTMSAWTSNAGLVVQATTTHSGGYAAEATSTGLATYARANLGASYPDLYARTYFFVKSRPSSTVSLIGFRTSTGVAIARLYIDNLGRLGLRNDADGASVLGPSTKLSSWQSVELHLFINGTSSTVEVWLDGNRVLSAQTTTLGTAPIGQVQIGENQTGRSYDIAFDDVVVQTARIGS